MTPTRRDALRGAGALGLTAGLGLGPSGCAPGIETGDGFTYRLRTLDIRVSEERRDEPYVAILGFRMVPGDPGSLSVRSTDFVMDRGWARDTAAGTVLAVPDKLGRVPFDDLRAGEHVGVYAIAMEWDRSSERVIENVRDQLVDGLRSSLLGALGTFDLYDDIDQIEARFEQSRAAALAALKDVPAFVNAQTVIDALATSGLNADDVIGRTVLHDVNGPNVGSNSFVSAEGVMGHSRQMQAGSNVYVFGTGRRKARYFGDWSFRVT